MKKSRLSFLTGMLVFAFVAVMFVPYCTQSAYASTKDIKRYVEVSIQNQDISDCIANDSVIVTLSEPASKEAKVYSANDFKEVGCTEIEDLTANNNVDCEKFKRILKLGLNQFDPDNVIDIVKSLNKNEDVLVAAPNYIYSVSKVPNDHCYSNRDMWGLNGTYGIQAESAWNITTGGSVTVGVIDTGIQGNHPDLVNRLSTAGLHRDCTVNPIKTVSNKNLTDPNGHGTHVAGIIGAQGNNSIGTSGVCWDVQLVSLRALDENGNGASESIIRAINFAVSQNIPILNFSGGSPYEDIALKYAIENYQGLFVCAAGNGDSKGIGANNDLYKIFPSDYSYGQSFSNRVISVGAIKRTGEHSVFSNFGANSVGLFAPGEYILSTYPQGFCTGVVRQTRWGEYYACECEFTNRHNDSGEYEWAPTGIYHYSKGYHYMSGTSMAAPHVTGVAALLLAQYPDMTAAELKSTIMRSVDKTSELTDLCVSGGRLNAYYALIKHFGHDYSNLYKYTDGKWHKAFCKCGKDSSQPHVIDGNSTSKVKTCLLCGGKADLGVSIYPNSVTSLPTSANGSYILPNGIIVLMREDFEAYFNGTLQFHRKNGVTQ